MSERSNEGGVHGKTTLPASDEGPSSAVLTFLIADVRGYTRFTHDHGDEAGARLAAKFSGVMREITPAHYGRVIELRGDEALAVFASARQALRGAIDLQRSFARESAAEPSFPLEVGIGLDCGEAIPFEGGFRGEALNLAARLCSLAGSGEVLASDGVVHLARKMDGLTYVERGAAPLKGFSDPVRVIQIVVDPHLSDTDVADAEGGADSEVRTTLPGVPSETSVSATPASEPKSLPIGGFLGALPAGLLVGRDEELQRIVGIVESVGGGMGQLVILAGEPGVGKTRLAQEVMLTVRNRRFLLATGSCFEPQQAVPFYPFFETLGMLHGSLPASTRADILHRWPHLGALLPDWAAHSLPSFDHREEQQRLFWGVTSMLQAIAATAPVALLLDDLQWADGSSLDLLHHLARHTRADRVLLLGTYRDAEVGRDHPLGRVLSDLHRQRLLERIELRRLRPFETGALIAATIGEDELSDELTDLLHQHTEGNPFFIQEVLRALVERGDVYRENGHWIGREVEEIEVPESVRSVIGQRLSRLNEQTQDVLREASVLGRAFAFDDIRALGDRSEEDVERAMEEAISAGLVRERDDTYTFNHLLTKQALHFELPARKRRRLHRAAGEAIERLPESMRRRRAAELEWHFTHAHAPDRALPYAVLVGDQAEAVFAHNDAATHYRTALEMAKELGHQTAEAEVREKLGGLYTATIEYDRAQDMLEQAARLYRSLDDLESEARVAAQIGRVQLANGLIAEGISRLQAAVESIPEGSLGAMAGLRSSLARLLFAGGKYAEAQTSAEQAAEMARAGRIGGVLAESGVTAGASLPMLGRWSEGRLALSAAIQIAEEAGDVFSACRGLQYLSGIYLARGELVSSRQHMQRALELAEQMDNRRQVATTTFGLSINAFLIGERAQSTELAEKALELMHALGGFWLRILYSAGLSLALSVAEWEIVPSALRECINLGEDRQLLPALRVQRLLAEKNLLAGHPEEAVNRLGPLLGTPSLAEQETAGLLPLLAWAYLEMGDLARSEATLATGLEHAGAEHLQMALLGLWRVQGMLRASQHQWEESSRIFGEAVALAHTVPYPYAEGRILYEWGSMRPLQGEGANEHFSRALVIFQSLGATTDVKRTVLALGRLT